MNGEAESIRRLSDDLKGDRGGLRGSFAGKAHIGDGLGDKRKRAPRQTQDGRGAKIAFMTSRRGHSRGRPRLRGSGIKEESPFPIGQVSLETQPIAAMLPPSGWRPDRRSEVTTR